MLGIACGGVGARAEDGLYTPFHGAAIVPVNLGGALVLRARILASDDFQLPLDFTTQEHTLVVSGTFQGSTGGWSLYVNAVVAIYSDSLAGGTPADAVIPNSYTDGECILSGAFTSLQRSVQGFVWGHVQWTGGTRHAELFLPPCILQAIWDRSDPGIPPGYDESWDGELSGIIDAVESRAWSSIKSHYR